MDTFLLITIAVATAGAAVMLLAGVYMLVWNRVPPPKRVWGPPDPRSGAVLVRPRLLGGWYACWGAVLVLVAALATITGETAIYTVWGLCGFLMSLGLTNSRVAKLGIPRGAYELPPD